MEHKVSWLVEDRVIHIEVWGKYEIETVRKVVKEVKILADLSKPPVHVVWDMRYVTNMTRDLRDPINEMSSVRYHPKLGWITIISTDTMIRFAGQIVSRFLGANYRAVSTFDEALETLSQIDPTVADALQKKLPTLS